MSYQETLKKHLAEYKLRDLSISESGVFLYQGEERKLPHILPFADRSHNLLKEAAPALEKYPKDQAPPVFPSSELVASARS
jgi:hypothetical protein